MEGQLDPEPSPLTRWGDGERAHSEESGWVRGLVWVGVVEGVGDGLVGGLLWLGAEERKEGGRQAKQRGDRVSLVVILESRLLRG